MNEVPPRGAPGERPRRDLPEAGIDISGHTTNHVNDYLGQPFDPVVTVCDDARERCPVLPGAKRLLHRSFSDPAKAAGSDD